MPGALVDPLTLPVELRSYLDGLVERTRAVCGSRLISMFAVGSVALGDYRHGRSDVDVTVVADAGLPERLLRELAGSLSHPGMPCPAAGLELVVYGADFAVQPSGAAGYLLDLNTGPLLENRASFRPGQSPAFWYVIDRAVAAQSGRLLYGRPVGEALVAPAPDDLRAALVASVREHASGQGHLSDNQVLNGCRAVAFCRAGRWLAKRQAASFVAESEQVFRPVIEAALRSFERPRTEAVVLPAAEVRAFLAWVYDRAVEFAVQGD